MISGGLNRTGPDGQFYLAFPDFRKGYALRSELTWTHYRLIMRLENEKVLEVAIRLAA